MTQIRGHNVCLLMLSWFKDFTVYLSHNDRENYRELSPCLDFPWYRVFTTIPEDRKSWTKSLRLIARTDCMFVWNFSASTFNAAMFTDLSKIHIHLCSLQFHQQANNDDGYKAYLCCLIVWNYSFTGKILSIWKLSLVVRIFVHVPGFGIQ